MESKIFQSIGFKHEPVAMILTNVKPEGARQFKEGKWGCIMFLLAATARGETAAFDRQTFGCWGGGVGLGFGDQYKNFPGGEACFCYFLSVGNDQWERGRQTAEKVKPFLRSEAYDDFLHGERYVKSPELVKKFIECLPMTDIPFDCVVFKQLKEVERRRIKDYAEYHKQAKYVANGNIWEIPCQVAMPSATQNEITGKDAAMLVNNGCIALGEGANMPTTPEGIRVFLEAKIAYGPGKAANAGGVATSALEMQQNASRDTWSFEYTEKRLEEIMKSIHKLCYETADEFGTPGNYVNGANIASTIKVAKAMVAFGLV